MEQQRPDFSPSRVPVSRQPAPRRTDCPDEPVELGYEELEERLAPGGSCCLPKKTAGWGC
jgi:hypothetical protein